MKNIVVTGIGTDVGKTIVSAILASALNADYWKPIQSGLPKDSEIIQMLLGKRITIHPEAVSLKAPLSPHHAAKLENQKIDIAQITLPQTKRTLIIEGAGGIFVPLNPKMLLIDLLSQWECGWIVVSRHYLGSINHTLLTIDALKKRNIPICGIIFNGNPCPETESAILDFTQAPLIARLYPNHLKNSAFKDKVPTEEQLNQEPLWTTTQIDSLAHTWKQDPLFQSALLK